MYLSAREACASSETPTELTAGTERRLRRPSYGRPTQESLCHDDESLSSTVLWGPWGSTIDLYRRTSAPRGYCTSCLPQELQGHTPNACLQAPPCTMSIDAREDV